MSSITTTTMVQPTSFKPLPRTPTSAPLVAPERSKWPALPDNPHPSFARSRRPFPAYPKPRAKPESMYTPASARLYPSQYPVTPRSPPSHIVLLPTTPKTPSHHMLASPQPSPAPLPTTPRSPPSHILLLPTPSTSPPSHIATQEKRQGFLFPPLILNVDFEESTTTTSADDIFTPISPSIQEIADPFTSLAAAEFPSETTTDTTDEPVASAGDDRMVTVRFDMGHLEQSIPDVRNRVEPKTKLGRAPSLRLLRTWKSRAKLRGDDDQKVWI